ncbi:MAG: 16S rRNA (cytidine(1402)-2'-O)-methyltransferase [Bacilli bacterium]
MIQNSYNNTPSLYLIPTPIGNLDDITYRAVKVLEEVEVIFSEDTRVTLNLLNNFGIKKKLISLHEHNENEIKEKVLDYLKSGFSVGLVTDRGTPIISDPGYKTVKYVSDNNFNVIALPGATAFVCALIASGISPQPFLFYGFLNSKDSRKKEELELLKDVEYTMIFYEAPHRIINTLNMMLDIFGNRKISISREITKKFETIYRGNINDIIQNIPEKGEFVVIVSGNDEKEVISDLSIKESVNLYIRAGFDVMSSIKKVARDKKLPKNEIYKEYHKEDKK